MVAAIASASVTRTQQDRLLLILEEAFLLVRPFFDPKNRWSGQPLEHLSFHTLRENYPDLNGDQIILLAAAIRNMYATLQWGEEDHKEGRGSPSLRPRTAAGGASIDDAIAIVRSSVRWPSGSTT